MLYMLNIFFLQYICARYRVGQYNIAMCVHHIGNYGIVFIRISAKEDWDTSNFLFVPINDK